MSYNATENSASRRIATLLDEGSFVEIGGAVTARSTTFNLTVTWFIYTARMLTFWVEHSERCMRRRSQESMIWL